MRFTLSALFALVVLASSVARADIESGPNVGTAVSVLKVFATTGDHTGKEVDYAQDRGAKPTVYIFIPYDRFDRPLARMLKAVEKAAVDAGNEASVVTVFLADDEAAAKDRLPKIQMSLQFTSNPLVIFPSMKQGPEGWQVNTDAQVTALVVKDAKVAAKFGYRSANETVVPEIAEALKKAIGKASGRSCLTVAAFASTRAIAHHPALWRVQLRGNENLLRPSATLGHPTEIRHHHPTPAIQLRVNYDLPVA